MRTSHTRQNGMTGIGWLTVLALIGFFTLLILKLGPVYLDHYTVKSTLESLKSEPLVTKKTKAEIRKLLKKRLNVNYVTSVSADDIKIVKTEGRLEISVEYVVNTHMAGNIDALISFSDKVELISN